MCVAAVAVLSSCGVSSPKVDYIPCKAEKADDWGFVDARGEVFLENRFENEPTPVVDGVFFVEEDDAYTMYRFDKKNPQPILQHLYSHGVSSEGLIPVCKKDQHIEVVDTKGKTQFVLDKIEGNEVINCFPMFQFGYLAVLTETPEGEDLWGVVNTSGKVVLSPKYLELLIFGENLFYVLMKDVDNLTTYYFIDKKGQKLPNWKKDFDIDYFDDTYIATTYNDRCIIYDMTGAEVLKCPSKVKKVHAISETLLAYSTDEETYGVINMQGQTVVRPYSYQNILLKDNKIVLTRSEDDTELLDENGNLISEILDVEYPFHIIGFGNVGLQGERWYILDDDYKHANQSDFAEIRSGPCNIVSSDYLDCRTVAYDMIHVLNDELQGFSWGQAVTQIPAVVSQGTGEFNAYTRSVTISTKRGARYSVRTILEFDQPILSPVYREESVENYSPYYGTYYTTETVVDSYRFNPAARLIRMKVDCNVPDSKEAKQHSELSSCLNIFCSPDAYGRHHKGDRSFELTGCTLTLQPYRP